MPRSARLAATVVPALLIAAACGSDSDASSEVEVPAEGSWTGQVDMYIPNAPGGGFDIAARALQQPLGDALGASVVPTNREGAGGAITAQEMLDLPGDGSAMMIVSRSISALPYTGTPEIDPVEDLAPLGVTHQDISALSVPASAPYQSVEEFLDFARDNPGGVTIGHTGVGGVWHAAALLLAEEAGVEFAFVPYDGGSAVGTALLAGEIDAMTIGAPESRPFIDGGDATMLAVMGEERSDFYPDVPTLQEEGVDVVYSVWRGYVVDAETPEDLRLEMSARLETAATSDAFIDSMTDAGFETTWIGAEDFGALIVEEDELIRELFEGEDFMTTQPERLG